MFFAGDEKIEPEKNPAVVLLRRWMPITKDYQGQRFFVRMQQNHTFRKSYPWPASYTSAQHDID